MAFFLCTWAFLFNDPILLHAPYTKFAAFIFCVLFGCSSFASLCSAQSAIPAFERRGLEVLCAAIGGAKWRSNANWMGATGTESTSDAKKHIRWK
jgi:hypothetical protein